MATQTQNAVKKSKIEKMDVMELDRNTILTKLSRQEVKALLGKIEEKTKLQVEFENLPADCKVPAQYEFQRLDKPVVYLRQNWDDALVAHELMHMNIELLDGYSFLGWDDDEQPPERVKKAVNVIRNHVDDVVVEKRLFQMKFKVDGEIIRPSYFDERCKCIAAALRNEHPREYDFMTALDKYDYGELYRSAWLVQAELYLRLYRSEITEKHGELIDGFITAFRKCRLKETSRANKVLDYFNQHDVQTVDGHREILRKWAILEKLNGLIRIKKYVRTSRGYEELP